LGKFFGKKEKPLEMFLNIYPKILGKEKAIFTLETFL
jgi:hypothetical protein